jgi:hypothetical protein
MRADVLSQGIIPCRRVDSVLSWSAHRDVSGGCGVHPDVRTGFCWLGVLCRCERGPIDRVIFDGRELSHVSLRSPAVVGPFDPGRDGQLEFLPGEPPLTVQDILLQQREDELASEWGVARIGGSTRWSKLAHPCRRRQHPRHVDPIPPRQLGEKAGRNGYIEKPGPSR